MGYEGLDKTIPRSSKVFRDKACKKFLPHGCLAYTEPEPLEHLVVDYGEKRGEGRTYSRFNIPTGDENMVQTADLVTAEIQRQSLTIRKPG